MAITEVVDKTEIKLAVVTDISGAVMGGGINCEYDLTRVIEAGIFASHQDEHKRAPPSDAENLGLRQKMIGNDFHGVRPNLDQA